MRERAPQPKGPLRPANKCSYQNIFLFLWLKKLLKKNKKITCKTLISRRLLFCQVGRLKKIGVGAGAAIFLSRQALF